MSAAPLKRAKYAAVETTGTDEPRGVEQSPRGQELQERRHIRTKGNDEHGCPRAEKLDAAYRPVPRCGSAPGVSDAFVSALWALNALFEMARVGADGVNIRTYPNATYQLFTFTRAGRAWRALVTPEYYGLPMFAQAVPPGSRLVATTTKNAQGVTVWATRGKEGRTRVVLVNESLNRRTIALSAAGDRPATLERLRAPRLTSTAGVTLGGQSFGTPTTTGRLTGRSNIAKLRVSQGRYLFTLPAESAALVTF